MKAYPSVKTEGFFGERGMYFLNHIIGFRSKNNNKMTLATLYYISGMVLSSGFEDKWFVFCAFVILFPVIVFELKDIFVRENTKPIIKISVCLIVMSFLVYIYPAREKVTNETVVQQEEIIAVETENSDIEKNAEEICEVETEAEEINLQEEKSEETVYKGKTGNKYHKIDCGTLKGKGTPISHDEAIKEGREACKICKP